MGYFVGLVLEYAFMPRLPVSPCAAMKLSALRFPGLWPGTENTLPREAVAIFVSKCSPKSYHCSQKNHIWHNHKTQKIADLC